MIVSILDQQQDQLNLVACWEAQKNISKQIPVQLNPYRFFTHPSHTLHTHFVTTLIHGPFDLTVILV